LTTITEQSPFRSTNNLQKSRQELALNSGNESCTVQISLPA